jgi:hypothetical protein
MSLWERMEKQKTVVRNDSEPSEKKHAEIRRL